MNFLPAIPNYKRETSPGYPGGPPSHPNSTHFLLQLGAPALQSEACCDLPTPAVQSAACSARTHRPLLLTALDLPLGEELPRSLAGCHCLRVDSTPVPGLDV